jgi:RNA polymerase sigma-70 factor (ECF subfamily)
MTHAPDQVADELLVLHAQAGDRRALATLHPDDRELLTLRHVEDLGITELATVFAIPTGTVKSRLHAARARLLAALTAAEKGTDHDTHR